MFVVAGNVSRVSWVTRKFSAQVHARRVAPVTVGGWTLLEAGTHPSR